MKFIQKIVGLFRINKKESIPLLLIKRPAENSEEYNYIEKAISDLESDPNVPLEKIENLKSSYDRLKHKTSIEIRDGRINK